MAKGSRLTQHKAQRDTTSPLKENRTLKQENRSLKRQLSKIRKQMGKMVESHMTIQQMVADEPQELAPEGPGLQAGGCEACPSGNVGRVQLPTGVLTVCKDCGHRKVQK